MNSLALDTYAAQALADLRPMLAGLAGLIGLIVGSFLNVVIYRVPNGLSVVAPRSTCPRCDTPIKARDNVPILSWLLLRAKCRTCAAPISGRYPAIEATTAALFAGLTWWGLDHAPAMVPTLLYVAAVSVALFMIDLDTLRLPDSIVKPSYAVLAALLALAGWLSGQWQVTAAQGALVAAVLAGLFIIDRTEERLHLPYAVVDNSYPVGAAVLGVAAVTSGHSVLVTIGGAALVWLGVFWLPWLLTKGRGMGLGDVKLAPLLGALLGAFGWGPALVGVMIAFVYGAVGGLLLMGRGDAGRKTKVPFGPYMLAGALTGLLAGHWLFGVYLNISGIA